MLDCEQKIYLASAAGALFFMLKETKIPKWKRFVYFGLGTLSASMTTAALMDYFSLGPATAGGVAFFCAVLVIPVADTLIDFARRPWYLVKIVRGVKEPTDTMEG